MNMAQAGERPGGIFTCSTSGIARSARADHFREAANRFYPGLTMDWPAESPIEARLESFPFAAARVTEFRNSANTVINHPGIHPPNRYHLVLHLAGASCYFHAGREIVQQPGDMMLINTDLRFEGGFPSGLRVLIWELPREVLLPLLADPESAMGRLIQGRRGLGAVLSGYALGLARQAAHLDECERRVLVHHLCSLVALALGATVPVSEMRRLSHRAAQRQRVLAYIDTHWHDCGLSAARAASELKLSRRWLYDLLDDEKIGFAARVSRRRIEECTKLLADPARHHLSMTEIAFRCGFGDLSTFSRRFRTQCGMTPREFRQTMNAARRGLS